MILKGLLRSCPQNIQWQCLCRLGVFRLQNMDLLCKANGIEYWKYCGLFWNLWTWWLNLNSGYGEPVYAGHVWLLAGGTLVKNGHFPLGSHPLSRTAPEWNSATPFYFLLLATSRQILQLLCCLLHTLPCAHIHNHTQMHTHVLKW